MKGLGMKKMMNIFKNIFEYFNMDNRKNRNELRSRQQDDFETKYGQYKKIPLSVKNSMWTHYRHPDIKEKLL